MVSVDSSYLRDFYWDLENPTQTYGTSRYISTFELNAIRGRILENDRDVFFQPHYYQCRDCSIEDLESLLEWIYNFHGDLNNVYVEFEADKAVFREYENCGCGTGQCCISRACEYSEVIQLNSYNELVQNKAYYFSTDLRVVDTVRQHYPEW